MLCSAIQNQKKGKTGRQRNSRSTLKTTESQWSSSQASSG
ncbi:hypothetical protein LEMLEM_LOCUS11161 [Lemmus lemmus]